MADLMSGTSTWGAGTTDSTTSLQNGVDERRAEHINGPASAIVSMQNKLGSAASLIGSKTDLAERLLVGIAADGTLTSAEPGDLCISARTSKTGWLFCDGSAVSRTTYANLFSAISTAFGVGDGSTTFNIPDFRGRVPVGGGTGVGGGTSGSGTKPAGGSTLSTLSRGDWKGAETHTLTLAEMPAHDHAMTAPYTNVTAPSGTIGWLQSNGALGTVSPNRTGTDGAGGAHNNIQPQMCVNFYIKY